MIKQRLHTRRPNCTIKKDDCSPIIFTRSPLRSQYTPTYSAASAGARGRMASISIRFGASRRRQERSARHTLQVRLQSLTTVAPGARPRRPERPERRECLRFMLGWRDSRCRRRDRRGFVCFWTRGGWWWQSSPVHRARWRGHVSVFRYVYSKV